MRIVIENVLLLKISDNNPIFSSYTCTENAMKILEIDIIYIASNQT
jgi:hypothetical protein